MRIKNLLLALVLFFPACSQPNSSSLYLRKHQALAITEKAREKVLASSVLNRAQEAQIVRTAKPTLTYYFLAKPYADYDIRWTINSDEAISVRGRGNILDLDGAIVERIRVRP